MDSGKLPECGLCQTFRDRKASINLFSPFNDSEYDSWYWGYDGSRKGDRHITDDAYRTEFTPLRQTIVLFLAAMNNEL